MAEHALMCFTVIKTYMVRFINSAFQNKCKKTLICLWFSNRQGYVSGSLIFVLAAAMLVYLLPFVIMRVLKIIALTESFNYNFYYEIHGTVIFLFCRVY